MKWRGRGQPSHPHADIRTGADPAGSKRPHLFAVIHSQVREGDSREGDGRFTPQGGEISCSLTHPPPLPAFPHSLPSPPVPPLFQVHRDRGWRIEVLLSLAIQTDAPSLGAWLCDHWFPSPCDRPLPPRTEGGRVGGREK